MAETKAEIAMRENKIEVFGDSVLRGVMFVDNRYKLYCHTLEEKLSQKGIVLHRNCRMGSTVEGGLARLKDYLEKEKPAPGTTVVLEFGGNDCAYNWKEISENPNGAYAPVLTKDHFEELYQQAIDLVKENGLRAALTTLIPIDAEKYLHFISRGLSYENIVKWLGDVSMLYRWHESYNHAVEQLAEKNGCFLVDLRECFLLSHDFSHLLCADGIHPTEKGHALIEEKLLSSFS